jgi:hypothetical protein
MSVGRVTGAGNEAGQPVPAAPRYEYTAPPAGAASGPPDVLPNGNVTATHPSRHSCIPA